MFMPVMHIARASVIRAIIPHFVLGSSDPARHQRDRAIRESDCNEEKIMKFLKKIMSLVLIITSIDPSLSNLCECMSTSMSSLSPSLGIPVLSCSRILLSFHPKT